MSYPRSLLVEDETITFEVRHHPFFLFGPAAALAGYTAGWIALVVLSDFFRRGIPVLIGLVLLAALAIRLAWRGIVWRHIELVLTDRRLIYRYGVVSRHSREIPLSKITDVTFQQMVLGRLLGMGDLVIESASESGRCAFFDLPHPERLKLMVLQAIHGGQGESDPGALAAEVARAVRKDQPTEEFRALPPERPPLYSEIVDQIERLDAMRRRGVLDEEEFEAAKRGLLGKLGGREGR